MSRLHRISWSFLKAVNVYLLFGYHLPFDIVCTPFILTNKSLNPLPPPPPSTKAKEAFCQVWYGCSKYHMFLMYLHHYILIASSKKTACAKFGRKWPSVFGEVHGIMKTLQRQRQLYQTPNKWVEKLTWTFGACELKNYKIRQKSKVKAMSLTFSE